MPLILNTPTSGPQVVSYKIARIMNDTINARVNVAYQELDADGNVIGNGNFIVTDIVAVRAIYTEIEEAILTGSTFEEASREVLYSKLGAGTIEVPAV